MKIMGFKICSTCCMVFQYHGYGEEICDTCKKEKETKTDAQEAVKIKARPYA